MADPLTPTRILQLGLGYQGAKVLLSAVELGLFTELAKQPMDGEHLRTRLGLHPRSARDFFDTLVALGMLERENSVYRNAPETDQFLDRSKTSYIGGYFEMHNARMYPFWGSLTEGLRTQKTSFTQEVSTDPALNHVEREQPVYLSNIRPTHRPKGGGV